MGPGPILGTTDAEFTLSYDPRDRTLEILRITGDLEWRRLFYDPQKDSGSLQDVTGQVGEVPPGGFILKVPPK